MVKSYFFYKKIGFKVLAFLGFNLQMLDTKFTTHKKRFGHVNATNRNSYMNTICIKFVTQVKKKIRPIKTKIRTFNLRFLGFLKRKLKTLKFVL